MLNAGNLALVAFSRSLGNQDGQVFALVVMVVAACEVVVGLGLIVAMFRRRLAAQRRRDAGAARPARERDHLRLARARLPAAGQHGDRLRLARRCPGGRAGWIGTAAIGLAFVGSIGALVTLLDQPEEGRQLDLLALDYASAAGLDIQLGILVDPLSVFMCLVVTGVSTLIHLYSVAYMESDRGLRPLLQLPQLLRLLDAAAGPGRQLRPADRRLGLRRLRLLRADQLLVPARHRDHGRDEGVRDQRRRRRRPGPRRASRLPRARHASTTSSVFEAAPGRPSRPTRAWSSRSACCSGRARSPSRRRSRFTPGCPTRWRARPRSRR